MPRRAITRAAMLHVNEMTFRVAGRPLFERATLAVNKGERCGLVGPNGSGKTTLLNLISGRLQPDEGSISLPRGLRLGLVAQDAPSGPESLLDTVLAADPERGALLEEAETAGEPHRIAEIHERLADIGAASAPARAARILAGLGFDEAAQEGSCRELSGGWRMRVALAALLFSQPDLLLLDEPTNHLDLEASLWLEGYLRSYPGTLLLVSHDRNLLNRVAKRIVHLEGLKLVAYSGNYDRFERTRRERLERQAALQKRQMAERRHIQAFVDRFRYKASKARQAQSRLKALARMEPIASVIEQRTVNLAFPEPEALAPPLVTLEGVAAGYQADRPVLGGLDLRLDPDERVALLGANGNGKTTFLRLLSGTLAPQDGRIVRSGKLRVGYFAQDQAEQLDPRTTALNLVASLLPKAREADQRAHLGRFGLSGDRALIEVGQLSGGEKARLVFALNSCTCPHLLLLDEPTNHLDVDTRQALVQAINEFPGAVVLVSHDSHLIELIADRLWLVAEGTVTPFDGDLEDYRRQLLEQRREERAAARRRPGRAGNGGRPGEHRGLTP
ncbi:MAG: ABC-F family ATP-binding cassette domain-containing protein, partial [Kiloniellales bacterium]|nr:ABC-F family ATP-binding cassette domain-containing protein [Kiloniellales bacterium]